MTKDTRLGTDPLAWMDDAAGAGRPAFGAADAPGEGREAGRQSSADHGRIFFPGLAPDGEDHMGKSGKIKLEQVMDTETVLAHLQDVVESMRSGVLRVESGDEELAVPVGKRVEFEMKISRKKDKAKCSFELEWEIDPEAEAPGVVIGGKE